MVSCWSLCHRRDRCCFHAEISARKAKNTAGFLFSWLDYCYCAMLSDNVRQNSNGEKRGQVSEQYQRCHVYNVRSHCLVIISFLRALCLSNGNVEPRLPTSLTLGWRWFYRTNFRVGSVGSNKQTQSGFNRE